MTSWRIGAPVFLGLSVCGCISVGHAPERSVVVSSSAKPASAIILMDKPDEQETSKSPDKNVQQTMALEPGNRLSLSQCIDQVVRQHPDLAIAFAQSEAARGLEVQAGLYPNPVIGYESDDMNSPLGGAGKQGASVTQTIVTGGKLRLSASAAAKGVESADWKAQAKLYDLATRVRSVFYDNLTAQQELETAREILKIAQDGVSSAERLQKAGIVGQPDLLRAQIELDQSKVKLAIAEQHVTTNWRLLANALGQKEMPVTPLDGSLVDVVPEYQFDIIKLTVVETSADLKAAQAAVAQADLALSRAEAEPTPDLQLQVRPFYSQPDRRTELAVGISAPLPIYNRNQGNIMAARATLAQAHSALLQAELQLLERLSLAFERYTNARQQVQAYSQKILPGAQESLRLILIAYSSGDQRNDFTAVLEAQRSLAQAKLGLVQARGELQKAVSEIEGMLQRLPAGASAQVAKPPAGQIK